MRHINLLFAMEATDGRHVGVISNNGLIWGDKNEWGSTISEPRFIHGDQAVASGMRYCLCEADSLMSTRHTWPTALIFGVRCTFICCKINAKDMKRKILKAIARYNYWRWDAAPKWGEAHEKQIVTILTAMSCTGLICALMLAVGYIMG